MLNDSGHLLATGAPVLADLPPWVAVLAIALVLGAFVGLVVLVRWGLGKLLHAVADPSRWQPPPDEPPFGEMDYTHYAREAGFVSRLERMQFDEKHDALEAQMPALEGLIERLRREEDSCAREARQGTRERDGADNEPAGSAEAPAAAVRSEDPERLERAALLGRAVRLRERHRSAGQLGPHTTPERPPQAEA